MQRQQQFSGRAVGAMDGKAPAELVGFRADGGAMQRDARDIFILPRLGAAGGDAQDIADEIFHGARRADAIEAVYEIAGSTVLADRVVHGGLADDQPLRVVSAEQVVTSLQTFRLPPRP